MNGPASGPVPPAPRHAPASAGPAAESGAEPARTPDEVVDCLGQRCPLPVIAAARRLVELPVGGVLRVLADDPAAAIDIPAWCRMRGQELLGTSTVAGSPAYDIRRAH